MSVDKAAQPRYEDENDKLWDYNPDENDKLWDYSPLVQIQGEHNG